MAEGIDENIKYYVDGFRRRAACIIVRSSAECDVLLVSSTNSPSEWIIPETNVLLTEEATDTVQRIALEKAGVIGDFGRCVGIYEDRVNKCRTQVYMLKVVHEYAEWDNSINLGHRRQWFPAFTARISLQNYKSRQYEYLKNMVATHPIQYPPSVSTDIDEESMPSSSSMVPSSPASSSTPSGMPPIPRFYIGSDSSDDSF